MFGFQLLDSVQQSLDRICQLKKQPQPDDGIRRKLALLSEQDALYVLDQIYNSKTEIRTLNGFIVWIFYFLCQPLYSSASPSEAFQTSYYQSETVTHSPVLYHPGDHGPSHLEALGELEFRRQFLILSYAGGTKLKDVIEVEAIRRWKNLPMVNFETKVWHALGENNVGKADRRLYSDWDSQRTHHYYCYVSVDGSCKFKGPFLDKPRTLLQKWLDDDNVLEVKFTQGEGSSSLFDNNYGTYSKLMREGILVGLRRYGHFVYSVGGNKGKNKLKDPTSSPVKCYFVRMSSDAAIDMGKFYKLAGKTMHEGRSLLTHVHTGPSLANYMARLSLILSKTVTLEVNWSLVKVEFINEEYCLDESGNPIYVDGKARIHTDGTGFISEDLALLCPEIAHKGELINNEHIEGLDDPDDELEDNILEWKQPGTRTQELPLLMQFRLFYKGYAIKGTFLVNKLLPPNTLQIRPSMVKVEPDPKLSDPQTVNSLEIVGSRNKVDPSKLTKRTTLSRNLIALLYHGGVPKEYFIELLMKALEETRDVYSNKRAAFRVALRYGEIDDNSNVAKMISCGIPLEEPYVQYRLSALMNMENINLKKGKICIPESYYLMGTADPTGKLEKDEVCIILKDGQLSGKVLVYRNPGVHFGDIHVLKATYVKELESVVGNAKYGIFFSCKGPRSVADEMGGGDFDGDLYWISRNPQLLELFKPSEPWIEKSSTQKVHGKRPTELSNVDLEDELIKLFLKTRFEPSFTMSEAAQHWMVWMDKFLSLGDTSIDEKNELKAKILQLIDIYYEALDAPKKGFKVVVPKELKVKKFPHFMEKKPLDSYHSISILGSIYDKVDEYETEDRSLKEIQKLPLFEVDVPEGSLKEWKKLYQDYRNEMTSAMGAEDKQGQNQAANIVIRKYKEILYKAEEFEQSDMRHRQQIYNGALAIYHVCYDYAKSVRTETGAQDVKKCGFAWKVAGAALCQLHEDWSLKPGEKVFRVLPSVLKDIM
ncbi:probable RNA-dependent RNA polymerase 3 [Rosa rugosa]|uniref:probable RNA-dependent RNA polymerase 3 n=1 Tax=Rosa rugosa TaxID=74645 RepID=UPI002B4150B7|nr:probable RNA-dependent RNA polymerase 3 [Rosa rugosa]